MKFDNCLKVTLRNCYSSFNNTAFVYDQSSEIELINSTIIDNLDGVNNSGSELHIVNCIFINNVKAVESVKSSINVQNSMFSSNNIGISLISEHDALIESSEFEYNRHASMVIIGSDPYVKNNNFHAYDYSGIIVNAEYIRQSTRDSRPIINLNNFFGESLAVDLLRSREYIGAGPNSNGGLINCQSNFWGSSISFLDRRRFEITGS